MLYISCPEIRIQINSTFLFPIASEYSVIRRGDGEETVRWAASHCQQHEGHEFHVGIATGSIQNSEVALCHDITEDSGFQGLYAH